MNLNFYITILVLCCCTNVSLWAQQPWCFTDQLHQQRYNSDAVYQQNFDEQQQAIHQRVVDLLHHATNLRDLYTIPVVVHIVSPIGTPIGAGNNLTDAQVATGLDMLNEAFANTNNFQSATGINTDIQFCLAQRTPDGQATNGILRHYSDIVNQNDCNSPSFNYGDEQQLMDIAFWDCCQYVNIYLVTDITGAGYGCSVAGYATVGSSCGFMVQESQYWNTFNGTQVTAHEMGHFFGLWHTFQNGCDVSANDCLVDGDNVCDTPPDNETFSACNANTCNTDSPDLPDDTNNYMDYGACTPWRFTAGQKTRMIATLETTQNCLLNSLACLSPCPAPLTANLAADATNITVGSTVNFTGAVTNTNVYTYNIDNQAPFANNTPNASHTFNAIGNYWVKLQAYSNSPLCYDAIDSIQINVNCNIAGEIIASATSINEGNTIIFGTNITGATAYQWTLNGTNVGTNPTYSQQFDDEGNYYVCVTASNSFCQKTDCQIIGVAPVGAPVGCAGSTFQVTYGGANEDIGTRVATDSDGGYIVAAYTKSFSPTNFNDGLLFKTSATGSVVWNKKIGTNNLHETLYDVKKTTDGGYLAVGISYPNGLPTCQGSPQQFGFLWRLDAMGNTLWVSKINGNTDNGETTYRAIETTDGGFAFIGAANYGCSVVDMMIGKVDANGNGLWCKQFANTNGSTDVGIDLVEDNNNIVVIGYTRSYHGDTFDNFHNAFVLKLNANGNEIWSSEYFSQNGFAGTNDNVTSITIINGNYLVTTTQQALQNWTTIASAASSTLMTLNPANGNIIWQKNFVVQGSQQAAVTSSTYNTTNQEIVYTFNDATNLINGTIMDGAIGIGSTTNTGGTLNSTYLGYGSIYHLDQVNNDGYVMTGFHTIAQQRDIYLGKVNNELLTPGCDNDSIGIEDINSQMQKTTTTWTVSNINNYIQANQQATITSVLLTQSDTLCSTICEELCDNFIDDNNNGLIDENCPCPTLSLSPLDTTLCQGQGIELAASIGFTTYQWSPTTGLSNPNIRNPIATPTQTTDYTVIATKLGENKIVNSDFSYGNFAFTSQQNYSATYSPCNYYVGTPWFGSLFPECVDHTPTDDNIFMHIDGCTNSPTTLWQQTITDITPNTLYKFSFWATRCDFNPPVFEIHFIDNANNDALMATQTQTQTFTQFWVWDEYGNIYWSSGNNTQLTTHYPNHQPNH
ncbi:MAG: hypothetical protein JNM36_18610 [Chitinophagales bacterium]|nr:hypothetical protein [Chitinophagales bacterium]